MFNVTQRIKEVHQPRGGYIKPSLFDTISLGEGIDALKTDDENVHASIVGLVVDYMTRFMTGGDKADAFRISIWGALCAEKDGKIGAKNYAEYLFNTITGLDDASIIAACKLTAFDVWYRCPSRAWESKPAEATNPNRETISDIRIMVERGIHFFNQYGPVTSDGFTFEPEGMEGFYENWKWHGSGDFGGYTRTVSGGDGDFLTADTLWDFKVSKAKLTNAQTLQLMMYYVMGQYSGQKKFKGITKVGIFNPRLNAVYLLDVRQLSRDIIRAIETEVLCYEELMEE